jgi:hypothetical protein
MWLYIRLPKKLVGLAKVAPKRPLKPSRPHKVPRVAPSQPSPAGAGARPWSVGRDTCPLPPDVLT